MDHASDALRWIPLLPLISAATSGLWLALFRRNWPRSLVILLGCGMPILSFLIALVQVYGLTGLHAEHRFIVDNVYTWIGVHPFHAELSFLLDPLSSVMVLVVAGVGSIIHIYSVGYMDEDHRDDRGFQRFFCFLNLFLFSMLMLVLGDNLLVLFIGWEGVGLCSYLLIGFWFLDQHNAFCGQKAFIPRRGPSDDRVPGDGGAHPPARGSQRRSAGRARVSAGIPELEAAHPCRDLFLRGRLREIGSDSALHLAARRDGGADSGLGPDPRRDDGHCRRLHGLPALVPLRARAGSDCNRRLGGRAHGAGRGHDRRLPERH
jgi:hypothetical protein